MNPIRSPHRSVGGGSNGGCRSSRVWSCHAVGVSRNVTTSWLVSTLEACGWLNTGPCLHHRSQSHVRTIDNPNTYADRTATVTANTLHGKGTARSLGHRTLAEYGCRFSWKYRSADQPCTNRTPFAALWLILVFRRFYRTDKPI